MSVESLLLLFFEGGGGGGGGLRSCSDQVASFKAVF